MRRALPVLACAGLAFAACGGGGQQSADCTKPVSGSTRQFTYRVDPVDGGQALERLASTTASDVCKRLRAVKAERVQVRKLGADRIRVVARNDERSLAAADFATRRISFQFYDWEPNVLGKRGPDRPFSGTHALYDAALLGSKSRPKAEATDIPGDRQNDTGGARYYVFDSQRRPVASGGTPSPPSSVPAGGKVVKVPRGVIVVQAERAPNQPASVQRFFVLEDDSELSGADIRDPKESFDSRTSQPVLTMKFSAAGRKAFARVTKREAQRGSQVILPPGAPKEQAFQRFAMTADREVLSLATIDFRLNPEGIDGRTGAQVEGIGTVLETKLLAAALKFGALPAELTLVPKRG